MLDRSKPMRLSSAAKSATDEHKAKARKILRDGRWRAAGPVGKAIVMGLLERMARRKARVKVVSKRKRYHLKPIITQHVETGSKLYTDELQSYRGLIADYAHEVIDHTEAYVRDQGPHERHGKLLEPV